MSNDSKTTRSKEVLSFLDQLDTDLKTPGAAVAVSQDARHEAEQHPETQAQVNVEEFTANQEPPSATTDEAEKTIAYLQNLALKKSSRGATPVSTSPAPDKGKQRELSGDAETPQQPQPQAEHAPTQPPAPPSGWGSWFTAAQTQAQAALAQAREVAEHTATTATHTPAPEWKSRLGGFVKGAGLDRLAHDLATQGKHALSEVYKAVVPPLASAEVLDVWVSHDMVGYDGIADVVYAGLAKSLELIEGGELVVNTQKSTESTRDINLLDNLDAATQLTQERLNALLEAEAELKEKKKLALSKKNESDNEIVHEHAHAQNEKDKRQDSNTHNEHDVLTQSHANPHTPIKLRVQPYTERSPRPVVQMNSVEGAEKEYVCIRFMLTLVDSAHGVECASFSQSLPLSWIEEESSRQGDDKVNYLIWIEGALIGVIKSAVEHIALDYLRKRNIDVTTLANNLDWSAATAQIPVSDY